MRRTASQILDVTDAEVWVMDPKTEYWDQTKALKDTDLTRVRGGYGGGVGRCASSRAARVAKTLQGRFAVSVLLGLDDATLSGAPRKDASRGSWERLREPRLHDHRPGWLRAALPRRAGSSSGASWK